MRIIRVSLSAGRAARPYATASLPWAGPSCRRPRSEGATLTRCRRVVRDRLVDERGPVVLVDDEGWCVLLPLDLVDDCLSCCLDVRWEEVDAPGHAELVEDLESERGEVAVVETEVVAAGGHLGAMRVLRPLDGRVDLESYD